MGEFQHSIDSKGRLIIPAKFRDQLGSKFVITRGLDGCLFGYPMDEWRVLEEKLKKLYKECIKELSTINIDITDKHIIGKIDIQISKRKAKRYGCCKQSEPDKKYYHFVKRGYKKIKVYDKFLKHDIEISKWVM